ncbi:M24 family metallopeptidase, partial [Oceanomicrobium pacificus]
MPASDVTDRYADLHALARDRGLDAIVLVPGPNFHRIMGKNFHSNERPLAIFVPVTGTPVAIVPHLEMGSFELVGFEGPVHPWRDQDGYQPAFNAVAAELNLVRVGVEGQVMRVFVHHALTAAWPGIEIEDQEAAISGLRIRKTDAEVAALEQAIAISEAALERTIAQVRVGQSERDVESLLMQALLAAGAEDFAFGPIVAAGDNSARPHAKARADYAIREGDALLFDFGARWGGLCADITRTFFIRSCSDEQRAVYDTVLAANAAGHAATRPGVTAHEIDDVVTGVLEASPYADRIRTKTGHGLGRAVHEDPYIMRGNH